MLETIEPNNPVATLKKVRVPASDYLFLIMI